MKSQEITYEEIGDCISFATDIPEGTIISLWEGPITSDICIGKYNNKILLKLCSNGDIYVKGELCDNRKEIVDAAYEFFCVQARENKL